MKNKTICIIPLFNDAPFINTKLPLLETLEDIDICIVDDGSSDGTRDILKDVDGVISIHHEIPLGFGSLLMTACDYARDMGYERLVLVNPDNENITEDIKSLMENIDYGYDLVSCSRVLENREIETMDKNDLSVTTALGEKLAEITGLDITDPLSGILAVEIKALEPMELTDETHGFLLQLWVQSHYFKLTSLEIPATSGESFASELVEYEDPLGMFLSIIETESYLYPNSTIN